MTDTTTDQHDALGGLLDAAQIYLKADRPEHLLFPHPASDALLVFLGKIAVASQAWYDYRDAAESHQPARQADGPPTSACRGKEPA